MALIVVAFMVLLHVSITMEAECDPSFVQRCTNLDPTGRCELIFGQVYDKAKCEDSANQIYVPFCLRTCQLCCLDRHWNCSDKRGQEEICSQMTDELCATSETIVHNIALNVCPLTCGLCNMTTLREVQCKDNDTIACAFLNSTGACEDTLLHDQIVLDCPVTCGFCDEIQECVDVSITCEQNKPKCEDPMWADYLKENCAKTCGHCGKKCEDTSDKCKDWAATGFCTSSHYTEEEKRQYCGITCNLC